MLNLLLSVLLSEIILNSDIQLTEDQFYTPNTVANCYGRNNILAVNIDLGEICIEFDTNFNEECMQLPPGIYLDIQLTNFPESVIRGEIDNFDYKNDKSLCYRCPPIGDDLACNFIQKTEAAQVVIKSLIRQTQLPIGQIKIEHAEQSGCYDQTRSQMFIREKQGKLNLYKSFKCPMISSFDVYYLKMQQLDGKIDQIQIDKINENGVEQVTFTNFDDHIEILFQFDFTDSYKNFYNLIEIELQYNDGGITCMRETKISLVQSLALPEMYLNPVFIIWASQLQLIADPLPNAKNLEEEYGLKAVRIDIRYEIFNVITGETLSNIFFQVEKFSFLEIDMKLACDDNFDGGECSKLLDILQGYDLDEIDILMHYHFYDKDGSMMIYASDNVADARNTCWTGVEGVYLQDKVCGKFVKNGMATSCPYLSKVPITFSIEFDGYKMSQQLNYSVDDEQVCIECQNQSCIDRIYELYQAKSSVAFLFQSGTDSFNLVSVNNYNENYSKLHERALFCGIAIVVLLLSIGVYQTLRFKGIIGDLRRAKKQQLVDNDDLR